MSKREGTPLDKLTASLKKSYLSVGKRMAFLLYIFIVELVKYGSS